VNVEELANHPRLRPQKLSAWETPHATIETNTSCNIRCRACYATQSSRVKPLSLVKTEIDLACEKRNLEALSLLGGEPTLHPDIVEIVRYVKSKGLVCMLLTNGTRFLYRGDLGLLDQLVAAGVDRFLLHIDSGQAHVHPDVAEAQERMCALLEERHVCHGLSLTLYAAEEATLAGTTKRLARFRWFDGLLVTLAADFDASNLATPAPHDGPEMKAVATALRREVGLDATAYIPSSEDDAEVAWLIYLYFIDAESGAAFGVSPELNRLAKRAYRKLAGHHVFAATSDPRRAWLTASLAGVLDVAHEPRRIGELARLYRGARQNLRLHYIVVQQAPRPHPRSGAWQICWQCPDATIRNGKLTPVCIAAKVNPLDGLAPSAPPELVASVFRHLGEAEP
jgi:hypothetical protein